MLFRKHKKTTLFAFKLRMIEEQARTKSLLVAYDSYLLLKRSKSWKCALHLFLARRNLNANACHIESE